MKTVVVNEDLSIKSGTGNFGGRQGANFNDPRQVSRGVEPPSPLPDVLSATYAFLVSWPDGRIHGATSVPLQQFIKNLCWFI